jgi:hypothetical protein
VRGFGRATLVGLVLVVTLFATQVHVGGVGDARAAAPNPDSTSVPPAPTPTSPPPPTPRVPTDLSPDAPQAEAATPVTVLYQGRLTDGLGTPIPGPVTLQVSLYAVASGGTALWTETHPNVPLTAEGIYSLLLGSITPFPANAWSDPDRWLGTTVNGGDELAPRMRVASVPFAIEANRLNGKRSSDFDAFGAADIAAAGVSAQLKGNDQSPPNQGSNQVHWNNLYGLPDGFTDGTDDVGVGVTEHGDLTGLGDNDHPQYLLGAAAATSDGNPPNLGSNRLHWDNMAGVPGPLVDRVIPHEWLPAGVIDSTRLGDGQVLARHLAPGTIGAQEIAPGSITGEQVADAGLTGDDIANSSLTGDDILNGTLNGADIQDGTLSGADILNGSLTGGKLSAGSVGNSHLQDGSVTESKLFEETVTASKLAPGSVTAEKLAPNAVGGGAIQPAAVTGNNIVDGSVHDTVMHDSPGLGSLSVTGYVDTVASLTGQTLASLTIDAPGPGWLQVTGMAQVYLLHDGGQASRVTLALATVPDVVPDSTATIVGLPGTMGSELYTFPAHLMAVFPVEIAGPVTLYLTGKKGNQPRPPSLHNIRVTGLFVPRRY